MPAGSVPDVRIGDDMAGRVEARDASEDGTLVLGDGRRLGYAWYGQPVFYFHGHPGSRLEARFARQAAARKAGEMLYLTSFHDRGDEGAHEGFGRAAIVYPRHRCAIK